MVQIYISPLTVSECSFSLWKYIYVCSQWNGTLLSAGLLVACVGVSGFWRPVFVLCVCWTVKWWLARAHKLGILSSYLKWMTHSERKTRMHEGLFLRICVNVTYCLMYAVLVTYVLTFSQNAFDFGFSSIYLNTLKVSWLGEFYEACPGHISPQNGSYLLKGKWSSRENALKVLNQFISVQLVLDDCKSQSKIENEKINNVKV